MLTPSILNSCRRKTKAGKKPLRFPPTLVFMCPTAHFVSGEAEKIGYPYRYRSRCQPKSYRTLNLGKTDKDMIKRKIDSYLEHFVKSTSSKVLIWLAFLARQQVGKVTYLPIYMTMFIQKEQQLPTNYKIDLSGLLCDQGYLGCQGQHLFLLLFL